MTPTTEHAWQAWAAGVDGTGARVAGRSVTGRPEVVTDPATGIAIATVGWVGEAVAREAVSAAANAFETWRTSSPTRRAVALRAVAADLRRESDWLGRLVTAESGKRLVEARAEVELSACYFEWFAGLAGLSEESRRAVDGRATVFARPVGVVAAVSPWNFPLSIPARKVAPAVAAGCTVVQKPSELTPLCSVALTEICERHLPAGVVNLVLGDGETLTTTLVDDDDVAAVTFTGSTAVGAAVAARAAASLTRTVLELGGRAPFIVTERADPDCALDTLMTAKFRNNGASCIAANNVFVHESVADEFVSRLGDRVVALRVGHPCDPETDVGPLATPAHARRVEDLVQRAEDEGASIRRAAWPERGGDLDPARFARPALVEAGEGTPSWDEEVFGPLCQVRAYQTEDAVVREVNSWRSGLGGYIASADLEQAAALAARLRVGIVGVNTGTPNSPDVPFGGFDRAGIGREGAVSGLRAFLEEQTIAGIPADSEAWT